MTIIRSISSINLKSTSIIVLNNHDDTINGINNNNYQVNNTCENVDLILPSNSKRNPIRWWLWWRSY